MGIGKGLVGEGVVGQDVHAKPAQNLDKFFGNLSHSHDAGGFSVHVESHQSFQFKVALARAIHRTVDFAVEAEHQRDGVFGHGMWRISGDSYYSYPCVFGCLHVYIVEAGATQSDELHAVFLQQTDYMRVAFGIDKDTCHLLAPGQFGRMGGETVFIIMYVVVSRLVLAVERFAVVVLRVEESYFYCHSVVLVWRLLYVC